MLLVDVLRAAAVAPAENLGQFASHVVVVGADVGSPQQLVHADLERGKRRTSQRGHRQRWNRFLKALTDQGQDPPLGVGNQAVGVHGNGVSGAKEAQRPGLQAAAGHSCRGDGLEGCAQAGKEFLPGPGPFQAPQHHFLGASRCRNQAHAQLDQAHVGFSRGLHGRGVQGDFATAPQGEPVRSTTTGQGEYLISMLAV